MQERYHNLEQIASETKYIFCRWRDLAFGWLFSK
jgi:hypothetical protein